MFKRFISLYIAICILLCSCIGRLAYVSLGNSFKVADTYNSMSINISNLYTDIYTREGYKLNNNFKSYAYVIRPDQRCINELDMIFSSDEKQKIIRELSAGYPVVRKMSKCVNTDYIDCVEFKQENSSSMMCRALISREYGGLEGVVSHKTGSLEISYRVDALGRTLMGEKGRIIKRNNDSTGSVTTSINYAIQRLCEKAANSMDKGAIVVMDVNNSQLLGCVSKGDDYINRAVSPYAVGSVFKLVISTAALENGIDPEFECKGSIKLGDTVFHCQKGKKHGKQHIKEALCNSCNCYFVNLALELGADRINGIALASGFNKPYNLFDGWRISAYSYPTDDMLQSKGQLALLGFGQGRLTDNPIHFAAFVSSIANGGLYRPPTLKPYTQNSNRIMKKSTANKLSYYMHCVTTDGTGVNANYKESVAGKTATAQSGIYIDGREQLNTWFAGFYPYISPKYAIVVMKDGGTSGAQDCCPIFRTIVEMLDEL